MTLIARTKAVMDAVLADIQRTPGEALLEGGGEAVWLLVINYPNSLGIQVVEKEST